MACMQRILGLLYFGDVHKGDDSSLNDILQGAVGLDAQGIPTAVFCLHLYLFVDQGVHHLLNVGDQIVVVNKI